MTTPEIPATAAALRTKLAAVAEENTRLRAALAHSDQPCAYCTLPAERWGECQHGFPGCARADDAVGCPELGARMEADQLRATLEKIAGHCSGGLCYFTSDAKHAQLHDIGRALQSVGIEVLGLAPLAETPGLMDPFDAGTDLPEGRAPMVKVTPKGYGSMKGQIDFNPEIDLAKPIAAQVAKEASVWNPRTKRGLTQLGDEMYREGAPFWEVIAAAREWLEETERSGEELFGEQVEYRRQKLRHALGTEDS